MAQLTLTKWNLVKAELIDIWEIVKLASQDKLSAAKGFD